MPNSNIILITLDDWLEILQNLGKSYKMNEIKDILLIDDQFF